MEEGCFNMSDVNGTCVNGSSSANIDLTTAASSVERRSCALYEFLMYGVVQLVITVVGLLGKFRQHCVCQLPWASELS